MPRCSGNQIQPYQQEQSESFLQAKSETVRPEPIPSPCQRTPGEVLACQQDEKRAVWPVHLADTFQSFPGVHWRVPDTVLLGRVKFRAALVFHLLQGRGLPLSAPLQLQLMARTTLLQAVLQPSISLLKKDRLAKTPSNVSRFDTGFPSPSLCRSPKVPPFFPTLPAKIEPFRDRLRQLPFWAFFLLFYTQRRDSFSPKPHLD